MRGMAAVIALLLAGCGRIGFDASADAPARPDAALLGPWNPPTPVVLPVSGDDDDPTLTSDLLQLYFNRGGSLILFATRTAVGQPWSNPVQASSLSSGTAETMPELAGDGLTIYFGSTRGGGIGGIDVWSATRPTTTSMWGAAVARTDLNTPFNDLGATMTADGLTLVMSTFANGPSDIYLSTRPSTSSSWSTPAQIPALSAPASEEEPFVTADGLAIYYSMISPNVGIYVSRRAQLTDPFPVGVPIDELDSPSEDRDPWVSPDGRYMMFSSDRGGGFSLWETSR
jgi:Tol biopolymer transport system component